MGRMIFSSPGWDEDSDDESASDTALDGPSRESGARFTAVTLTCLSALPAVLPTIAFFLVQLPPLDRDDYPEWVAPSAATLAPGLLPFLLPPIATGALSRLVEG